MLYQYFIQSLNWLFASEGLFCMFYLYFLWGDDNFLKKGTLLHISGSYMKFYTDPDSVISPGLGDQYLVLL